MAGTLKKLTVEQVSDAVTSYQAGMSLGDLAQVYSVSRQSMWDLLRRRIPLRPRKRTGSQNHFYRGGRKADKRAHDLMEKALDNGLLINPNVCESCGFTGTFADGRTAIQGHHDDYNEPLKVRWLCQKCHHEWHKTNTPISARRIKRCGST